MSFESLSDISIVAETGGADTGNLQFILAEIEHALQQLLAQGETHCIDLKAMPLTANEEKELEETLGQGEVFIELKAMGKSRFVETKYSGVWSITHWNEEDEIVGRLIEITFMPDMILTQREDINQSLEQFRAMIDTSKEN
jgi:hydrogenase-1 operon protein HyaF